jgi:hemolysin D
MEPATPAPAPGSAIAVSERSGASRLPRIALEFQPDAVEIEQRPLPFSARTTLYVLLMLIVTAVVWAAVTRVDRIVVAHGKLVTIAPTIVVQPLEISILRSLEVRVGDIVHKGDILATLDPTFTAADAAELQDKVASLDAQIGRLNAELTGTVYAPKVLTSETRLQLAVWIRDVEEYRAKIDSYERQIQHADAEMTTKSADYAALEPRLSVARELESMREKLMEKAIGSKINYLDAKGQRIEIEREMRLALDARAEFEQDRKRAKAEEAAYVAEYRRKVAEDLVQARRDRDTAAKQLEKAALRKVSAVLTAPADAIVLEIAQRSVGSVMKEAEPLFTLVPLNTALEADVKIGEKDIGFVKNGATVRIKLDAYPFQKHGTLSGVVRTISDDSFTEKEKPQEAYYQARISLTSDKLRDVPTTFHLIPGMTGTAEIKAGKRTVLSYFLYPFLRGLDEGIREP